MNRSVALIFLPILSLAFFVVGLYFTIQDRTLSTNGIKVQGTVIILKPETVIMAKFPQTVYVPVVSFITTDNKEIRFDGDTNCCQVGQVVSVMYDPNDPQTASMNTVGSIATPIYYLIVSFIIFGFYLSLKKK